jgi:LuxR family transcriptional regulator, quorum-sensing system regulator SolR
MAEWEIRLIWVSNDASLLELLGLTCFIVSPFFKERHTQRMNQPANFDSVVLDGLLADWMAALQSEAVEALVVLGPAVKEPAVHRCVHAVHPPRLQAMAQALAESEEFGREWAESDSPLALWQDISRGSYADLSRWRMLALSHGLQSMVRVAFMLPRGRAFECYLMTPRALHEKSEATALVWSILNIWPRIKRGMAEVISPLSPREKECLALAFDGLTAAETAAQLVCSERTVNYYLSNAMRKLGVDNKLAATERAVWHGVI